KSINRFYAQCSDVDTFYIKLDDDIVFIEHDALEKIYRSALADKGKYLWWSPLVINNAICSWLLKYHSDTNITGDLSCQAADLIGWRSAEFAVKLHQNFLDAVQSGD